MSGKPVNSNPGVKVNSSINYSNSKQKAKKKTSTQNYKTQILAYPGLASLNKPAQELCF